MKYFVGLDNGGTTTKAAIFDCNGCEVGSAGTVTKSVRPEPGYVERDMEEMWQENCTVLKEVISKTGVDVRNIAGIGVCGHGKGLYLWGKNNRPVRNGIISTDNRACTYTEKWKVDGTEEKAFRISGQHVMSCQPVALLAWVKEHEPENYKNIQYIFACKDYIRFRLTQRAGGEITDYSGGNLINLYTRTYDKRLLQFFGIEEMEDALPPLCLATQICGHITKEAAECCGLKEGTPVIGGMFDINACAIAAGIVDSSMVCMIAGTWSINEYISRIPILDGKAAMNSLYCLPDYYLIEESSATSAGNHEWFVERLLVELAQMTGEKRNLYEIVDGWVESIPAEEFVPIFLPFLMASNVHPNAKGTFAGLQYSHDRRHLARSVFEGICFSHRYHLEKLLATRKDNPLCIRLAGGASKAKVWAQMFADVMKFPVETIGANETGALGCAIAAAAATGEYSSLDAAISMMSRVTGRYEPNCALQKIYDQKYDLYLRTVQCLNPLWEYMQNPDEEERGRSSCA